MVPFSPGTPIWREGNLTRLLGLMGRVALKQIAEPACMAPLSPVFWPPNALPPHLPSVPTAPCSFDLFFLKPPSAASTCPAQPHRNWRLPSLTVSTLVRV